MPPTLIPATGSDFSPLKAKPVNTEFVDTNTTITRPLPDPDIAAVQQKKQLLLTYHELFGHLSFSILQLMECAGLIPKYLANVNPPTCLGCAYGKAIRKQTRYKGI